jgi:hypothetical protein
MNVAMEVAIHLIPLVDEVVPVHEDRVALVLHVTGLWLARGEEPGEDLDDFISDYVTAVDVSAYGGRDPYRMRVGEPEALVYETWRRHVTALRPHGNVR